MGLVCKSYPLEIANLTRHKQATFLRFQRFPRVILVSFKDPAITPKLGAKFRFKATFVSSEQQQGGLSRPWHYGDRVDWRVLYFCRQRFLDKAAFPLVDP